MLSARPLPVSLAVGAFLAACCLAWLPAWSHAGLVDTEPAARSSTQTLPDEVRLTFNEDMNRPSYVTVTAPDGSVIAEGEGRIEGREVVQTLADPGLAGTYRVDYRAVSRDGHPVTGAWEFDITTGRTVEQSTWESVTSSGWWWAAVIAVPWVLLAGAFMVRRRRAQTS